MGKGLLKTFFTGRNLISTDTTASTNNYAIELLANSEPIEGTAILAEYQQHGKGQRGSTWISEFGANLLVSYILYPRFMLAKDQFHLSLVAALATSETLRQLGAAGIFIKWPNDIYAGNCKIAGILVENTVKGSSIASSVIGIGVNINQRKFPHFPAKATSLFSITGVEYNKTDVFERLSNNIEKYYLSVKNGNTTQMKEEYLEQLYRINKFHNYESDGKSFTAKIIDVNEEGKLLLETSAGKVLEFWYKEIKFLP